MLDAGRPVEIVIEYSSADSLPPRGAGRVPPAAPDDLMERARGRRGRRTWPWSWSAPTPTGRPRARTARRWPCPAIRTSSCAGWPANPRTVVVLNTGSPVTMPWADDVRPRSLQTWFGGQEMAGALADVLAGVAEPGGRLSMTFPRAPRGHAGVRQLPR